MAPKTMKSPKARVKVRKPVRPKADRPAVAAKSEKAPLRSAPKGKPLSRREIAELKQMLEEERRRLNEELEAMEEHTPELEEQVGMDIGGGYDEDLADVASSTFEREKGLALESSVQATLTQVDEALQRIADGTYGFCQRCGNLIDFARLKVLPYALLCIRCKEQEEKVGR
jgi:DnaK suppressor protein